MSRRTNRALARATALGASVALAASLAACSAASAQDGAELGSAENPVRLGVVGASEPYWETYETAVEEAGIALEIVDFAEYTQPNPALSEGELDINQFQHIIYLATYNTSADDDLTPIGATAIYPLGLYSDKYDTPDAIPDGSEIAIPNDETNQARALLVLQSVGLVALEDGGSPFSTPADIIEAESRVTVRPLDAAITVTSLPDVAGAVVNNDFLGDAGLSAQDAIAKDDPSDPSALPYVNIFATQADRADDPVLQRLVEIYQGSQAVLDGVQEAAGGTAIFATTSAADLQAALADVEADIREQ